MTGRGCVIAPFLPVIASEAWQSQESQNSKIKRQKDRAKIKNKRNEIFGTKGN
jgi:hypothetical protein